MREVAIITDSAACLPQELIAKYEITVVPMWLIFSDQSMRDGVDISTSEFYQRIRGVESLPKTSSPSPGDYLAVFESSIGQAKSILVITYSKKFGMAYESARIARDTIGLPEIEIVDSETATMAEGFVVLAAARAIESGGTITDAVKATKEAIKRVGFVAMIQSLTYLQRSGRVPSIAEWVGRSLGLRLILRDSSGSATVIGARRSDEAGISSMLVELAKRVGDAQIDVSIFHGDWPKAAERLNHLVQQDFTCNEMLMSEFTPVMGAHAGPEVVGLAYCVVDK